MSSLLEWGNGPLWDHAILRQLWWCPHMLRGGATVPLPRTTYSEQEANAILCHCHFWSVFLLGSRSWLSGGLVPLKKALVLRDRSQQHEGSWCRARGWHGQGPCSFVYKIFFWFSVSRPGNAPSAFPLHTNQAMLPTHILCQTCQLLQGPRSAYKWCLPLLPQWRVISSFGGSAFVLVRRVNTEVPDLWELLMENLKLTWTIRWPS